MRLLTRLYSIMVIDFMPIFPQLTANYNVGVLGGLSYIPSHGGGLWETNINHSTGVCAFVYPSLKD